MLDVMIHLKQAGARGSTFNNALSTAANPAAPRPSFRAISCTRSKEGKLFRIRAATAGSTAAPSSTQGGSRMS